MVNSTEIAVHNRKNPNRIREGSKFADIFIYIIVGVVCLVTLYPFYYVFIQSFASPDEVVAGTVWLWPKKYYFGSYELIFSDPKMWRSYAYTILYVVSGTLIMLLTSVLGAYPLSVDNLWGRKFVVKFIIFTMYFGGGLIPTFILMTQLKLYNNIWVMIIPGAVSVWNIILVRTFFMTIPGALKESAFLDGAGHVRILFSIIVPLSKPVLAVVAIYTIVGIWNSWFNAMIYLPNPDLHPLQFYLYRVMIQQSVDLSQLKGEAALQDALQKVLANFQLKYALIIFTTLPVIFTYPFFQKHFVKGVMLGSLKG
ncbi:MAG: carbohydrate ABC transporter permease [Oscillospiraceae bacterium]